MPAATPRTAVLMITVWLADGDPSLVRARLTEILDLDSPARPYAAAADADAILRATAEWLIKIQEAEPSGGSSTRGA
jgi:hypothetical protein